MSSYEYAEYADRTSITFSHQQQEMVASRATTVLGEAAIVDMSDRRIDLDHKSVFENLTERR